MASYVIENVGPSLHRDTLEDGDHGIDNVVKVDDAAVGSLPPTPPGPRRVVEAVFEDGNIFVLGVEAGQGIDA